ncbi:MAG: aminotransferase class I/II-fold pyridoxal phosphate-dependent enzyme [Myxococcales bacterium]|nr:aminotransferase class I/II-fold pyridoxal phosphate-dependent enzyme [Myxococcales bacterium]
MEADRIDPLEEPAESEETRLRTRGRLGTRAVHAGEPRPGIGDSITMPLFQSSTYVLGSPESFDDIRYVRLNNTPNQRAVEAKLAALEMTEAALVTPSGTAAIAMALTATLLPGDHILAPLRIYGGTRKMLDTLASERDLRISYLPHEDPEAWYRACRPETRMLYAESITNPWLDVPPLDELGALARDRGLLALIDNTLASPVNFRPVELGFDLMLHSASKYLNGHTDVVAGVVAGAEALVQRIRRHANHMGVCLDPHSCFLLQRGCKTLPLRVRAQNEGAELLAQMLSEHPAVARVHHPSLPGSASHERAERLFDGYGAMVSFVPHGGKLAADRLISRLQIAREAPSLGGVETLVCRPATTSHAGISAALREQMGVPEGMVRVSVGVEEAEDLLLDFHRALTEH